MSRRPSFSERRRRKLTIRPQVVRLEARNTMTEPISLVGLMSGAFGGLARLGLAQVGGGHPKAGSGQARAVATMMGNGPANRPRLPLVADDLPIAVVPGVRPAGGGGASAEAPAVPRSKPAQKRTTPGEGKLASAGAEASTAQGLTSPWKSANRAGGGAAMAPRGGSGSGAQSSTLAAIQGRSPLPHAVSPPAAPPTIPGVFTGSPGAGATGVGASAAPGGSVVSRNTAAQSLPAGSVTASSSRSSIASGIPVFITENRSSAPYSPTSGGLNQPLVQFPYFPLYTLDYIQGAVLFSGGYEIGIPNGNVDLRAQVKNGTGVTFSWNTSGLTNAYNISGTSTYDLTFTWSASLSSQATDSVTLTATDTNGHQEVQTYYFLIDTGTNSSPIGSANWPTTIPPDTVLAGGQSTGSDGVSVDSNSGALDTSIALPSYNPNVPGLALTYDSLTADPRPIIEVPHTLDPAQSVPSKVNATLTFNGTAGTKWYYNTSGFIPGDVQEIALQANATSLSTGRYTYSAQVVDQRSSNTTFTYSGSATVLNQSSSAFGDGWTLQGLEQITSATGGVILGLGGGGKTLWFSGSPGTGGNYTTPAGDFSTLTKTSTGYTRTLTDGTQITFNASGYETATIDLNGLHTTYGYNGSNQLTSVEDPYGNFTTLTYSSGKLSTILDPASRLTTFGFTGNKLTSVRQADGSHITYTYDSAGRLTQYKDPNGHAVTVTYDSAERVGTITRPDSTTQEFSAAQEQGWTNSGTSGSPAAATLLAESAADATDPNGNLSQMRPDWYGLGTTGQTTDALGNVTTNDISTNGLATTTIDNLNRITQYQYDSLGNTTQAAYADGTSDQYTYNSDSEALTHTDPNGDTTSYTYDSHGNNTVVQDALHNLTTMTYTSNGRLQTRTDADNHTTTYQYDSQDRLTTIQLPDGTTNLESYNSQGNVVQSTDGRGNATTYSYDAVNRQTGTTDAQGNHTTVAYDAAGNKTAVTDAQSHTTSYAYDSLNRLTTITDPLGHTTIYGFDGDGNETYVKDSLGRITTYQFDAVNDKTVTQDAVSGNTTTLTYDGASQELTSTDAQGTTTYTYSVRGWTATTTDALSNVTTFTYNGAGGLQNQYEFYNGRVFVANAYSYDGDERVSSQTDGLGYVTSYTYDGVGNKLTSTDQNANTTTYVYDSMNRQVEVIQPGGVAVSYTYDSSGNRETVTDALGHTTTTLYDVLDRATTVVSAVSGTTTMTYDAVGHETSLTDPDGNTTQWAYDAGGRMTTMTLPNSHTVTNVYDADNELVDTTDADGRRTTYSYNNDGRKTGETWLNGSGSAIYIATYTYDAADRMTGATDPSGTLTFTYNGDGELLTAATSGPGSGQPAVTLTYSYDQLGDKTSVSDSLSSQGITSYSYDPKQEMTGITTSYGGSAGPQVTFTYDNGGRLTFASGTIGGSGTEINTTYTYDGANRVVTTTHGADVFNMYMDRWIDTPLATYVYGYDSASRLTSEQDAEGTATFTYDNANELTAVGGSRSESYSYDLNGNRTGTGYSTGTDNEQTASPGTTYTYDNAGNMVSQTNTSTHVTTTYTYDYRNRLTEVTQGGTIIATYTYDVLNRRNGIDDSSTQTWTVYDGTSADALPYADFNGSGSLTERYLTGAGVVNGAVTDQLLTRTSASGVTAWYLTDKLGSVRDIVNTSGTSLDHVVYDSYGNIVTETNATNGDRFKYAGMEYDSATGQNYDRARYYNKAIGRFMTQDPMGFAATDSDLYRYVGNGPSNSTDPSGLADIKIVSKVDKGVFFGNDQIYSISCQAAVKAAPGWSVVGVSVNWIHADGVSDALALNVSGGQNGMLVKGSINVIGEGDWMDNMGNKIPAKISVTAVEYRMVFVPLLGMPIPIGRVTTATKNIPPP